eukprot:862299-Pleurochrysis_carterae.AAC.1
MGWRVSDVWWIHKVPFRVRHSHQFPKLTSGVKCSETLTTIGCAGQVETTACGVCGVSLPCRCGCVAKLSL